MHVAILLLLVTLTVELIGVIGNDAIGSFVSPALRLTSLPSREPQLHSAKASTDIRCRTPQIFNLTAPLRASTPGSVDSAKLRKEILSLRAELKATSSQDEFAKWAKIRRNLDKKVAQLEDLSASPSLPLLPGAPLPASHPTHRSPADPSSHPLRRNDRDRIQGGLHVLPKQADLARDDHLPLHPLVLPPPGGRLLPAPRLVRTGRVVVGPAQRSGGRGRVWGVDDGDQEDRRGCQGCECMISLLVFLTGKGRAGAAASPPLLGLVLMKCSSPRAAQAGGYAPLIPPPPLHAHLWTSR